MGRQLRERSCHLSEKAAELHRMTRGEESGHGVTENTKQEEEVKVSHSTLLTLAFVLQVSEYQFSMCASIYGLVSMPVRYCSNSLKRM
jgi:hypothetical protein